MGHHQEENLILHVSKCPIYILHCAKTFTIMVSCGGFIAKLTESRNVFCSLVLPKMLIQDQGRPFVKNYVGGHGGDGDGVSNAGLTLVVSELSRTILIMQKSTSTLTLKSVPNT